MCLVEDPLETAEPLCLEIKPPRIPSVLRHGGHRTLCRAPAVFTHGPSGDSIPDRVDAIASRGESEGWKNDFPFSIFECDLA